MGGTFLSKLFSRLFRLQQVATLVGHHSGGLLPRGGHGTAMSVIQS